MVTTKSRSSHSKYLMLTGAEFHSRFSIISCLHPTLFVGSTTIGVIQAPYRKESAVTLHVQICSSHVTTGACGRPSVTATAGQSGSTDTRRLSDCISATTPHQIFFRFSDCLFVKHQTFIYLNNATDDNNSRSPRILWALMLTVPEARYQTILTLESGGVIRD